MAFGTPAESARSRPRLCLVRAILALAAGDAEGAGPLLDAAERAFTHATDEPFDPSASKAASLLVNVPAGIALGRASLAHLRGDADGTAAFASQALAKTGEGESMLNSTARWLLAMADWLRGRAAEAERAFAASITGWRTAGERYSAAFSCHHLGQVQRAQGRLDAALGTYQQALEITAAPGRPAMPAAGIAFVGMGEVAYQRNELEAAVRQVTNGIERCRQLTAAANVVFWAWPAAPPRFSVPGMTDILVTRDILGAAHPHGATGLVNLYAAMPSLHVAWAAWCALAVVTASRGRWRRLAWLYPAVTTLVVLASANHFLLDAGGGLAVAGLGLLAASRPAVTFSLWRRGTGQPAMAGGPWMAVDGLSAAAAIGLYTTAWRPAGSPARERRLAPVKTRREP